MEHAPIEPNPPTKKLQEKELVIIGNSMTFGIDGTRIMRRSNIKVSFFLETTTQFMEDFTKGPLKKITRSIFFTCCGKQHTQ